MEKVFGHWNSLQPRAALKIKFIKYKEVYRYFTHNGTWHSHVHH